MLLMNLPMPPSMNGMYDSAIIDGKQRRVKAANMKAYERDMATWALANSSTLRELRAQLAMRPNGFYLTVDATFLFHRANVRTLKGLPKRNDTSNRIKALHDQLAQLFGVDDCWIWDGSFKKRVLPPTAKFEHCNVTVGIIQLD